MPSGKPKLIWEEDILVTLSTKVMEYNDIQSISGTKLLHTSHDCNCYFEHLSHASNIPHTTVSNINMVQLISQ
jgi:hypothetical protein